MPDLKLQSQLDGLTRPAELTATTSLDPSPSCTACAHRCRLAKPGDRGICGLRFNRDNLIMAPQGYVTSLGCDPLEKKPLYHFLPGQKVLSFGMAGCNLHCEFCQNWTSSQFFKEPQTNLEIRLCTADELVEMARHHNCQAVASTYNEPLISSEWAVRIFRRARSHNLATCYVSNGFASTEVLQYLEPWIDAFNIDLKMLQRLILSAPRRPPATGA